VIDKPFGPPHVTKDGVTVAESISSPNRFVNMGMSMIKEAAIKTAYDAGDGTTTSTVICLGIIEELAEDNKGNLQDQIRGINDAKDDVIADLKKMVLKPDENTVKNVAMISGNNDLSLASTVESAYALAGEEGIIKVVESSNSETTINHTIGYEWDKGLMSPEFATNMKDMVAEYDSPCFLFYEGTVRHFQELTNIIGDTAAQEIPLVIIADDIEGAALGKLIMLRKMKNLPILAIKAPSFGDERREMMIDICSLTGGFYVKPTQGYTLDKVKPSQLGQSGKVLVTKKSITIIEGLGDEDVISDRVKSIRQDAEKAVHEMTKENLLTRASKLSSGVVTISVGGSTEMEMRERKDRMDDAVCAVRAALKSGIVPGAGYALFRSSLNSAIKAGLDDFDGYSSGYHALLRACEKPAETIWLNSGREDLTELQDTMLTAGNGFSYDLLTGKIVNLVEKGIVDPYEVVKSALENAVSVACMILSTEAVVVIEEQQNNTYGEF
jgi:chaperonin GroEL